MFIEFEGKIVFLPYSLLSKYQFIVSEIHRAKLNKLLKLFYWFSSVIAFLIIFNIKFLYVLILPMLFYEVGSRIILSTAERMEFKKDYKYKDVLRYAMEQTANARRPISWLMALLSGIFFLVLLLYILFGDLITDKSIETFLVSGIPFFGLITISFWYMLKLSRRK